MPRIAFDATAISAEGKGQARTARGAVEALARRGLDVLAYVSRGAVVEARAKMVHARPAVWWEQVGLARAARRHDIVITFTERLPVFSRGRFVVWLFELPTHRVAENKRAAVGAYQRGSDLLTSASWRRSLRRAAAVLTGSEATARELRAALPGLAPRVVYPGLDEQFTPGTGRDGRYVFHLGSGDPRDNTDTVVAAVARANERLGEPVSLLVAGGARGAENAHVRYLGRVPDEELVTLYRGAAAYLDASLYEGFGYQPLEAMACGAPVIASRTSSIPEVVGDAGILCDPRDVEAVADALVHILENPQVAAELRRRARERVPMFGWERAAEELEAVIQDLLS